MSELECVMIMIDFSFFFFLLGLMLLLHIKCGFYIAVIISGNILPGDSSSLHLLQYQLEEGEAPQGLDSRSEPRSRSLAGESTCLGGGVPGGSSCKHGGECAKNLSTRRI